MDGGVENPEIPVVSEKSRSLDAQSFSDEKSRAPNGLEGGVLKRKHWSVKNNEENGSGQAKQRRKGRKEVSLSSLENASEKPKKGSDSNKLGLNLNGFSLIGKNQSKKRKRKNGNGEASRTGQLQNSVGLTDLPRPLDDNVIVVPKRPRGFSGRNKFHRNPVGKQEVSSALKGVISQVTAPSSAEFSKSKLNGDPEEPSQSLAGKRKKALDEFNDNSSSGTNIVSKFKDEGDGSDQVTSSKAAKRACRDHRKRQKSEGDRQTQDEFKQSLVDHVSVFQDLQEDDEENLEQNAARMLSSRFDPSCTGFSGRGVSESQSADGVYFSPFFDSTFKSLDADASVGSETVSADSAGRVLRPRKQHKHKGFFKRRRRHFYEVCSTDLDPYWVVNQRIKVFWPLDQSWYFGIVKDYDLITKLHHIKYDDRDEEWVNLQNERFKLLLLPGEVPGKSCPDKPRSEAHKTVEDMDSNFLDENCIGNFTDSEPIISWLSRSTHRMKSSPNAITKKQIQSRVLKHLPQPIFSENSFSMPQGRMDVGPSIPYANKSYMVSVKPDRSVVGEVSEKSLKEGGCSTGRKMHLVYFRRRFRNRCRGQTDLLVERSACRSTDGSVTLLAAVERAEALDEYEISLQSSCMKDLKLVDRDTPFTCVENLAMMELSLSHSKSKMVLMLSLPPLGTFDLAFETQTFWLYSKLLLFKNGQMVSLWPNVRVEMLFVDNIVGLRYMLFEGCLKQAVAFLCFIITFFHQLKEYGQLGDLQLPVTSVRFKLLGLQGLGGQLEFVFYNFLELKSSKWLQLDDKLKQHCLVTKELPLAECTYANIKTLQSGSEQHHIAPVFREPVSLQKRSRRNTMFQNCPSCKFDEKLGRLPPLILSFSAAPTFFLSLHLNMLMENNVASVSLQNQCRMSFECSERFDELTGADGSLAYDTFDQDSEIAMENIWCSLRCTATSSLDDGDDWKKTSQRPVNGTLDMSGASGGCQGAGKNDSDRNVSGLEKCSGHTCSWTCTGKSHSSASECLCLPKSSENGCLSHLNHISIQTSSLDDDEGQPLDQPKQTEKLLLNDFGSETLIDATICSSNPTAPRSMWHSNRHGSISSSFSYRSKLWPDFVDNGIVNGHKKPRTQVSYLLPFGGYSFGSKPRSQRQKVHRYKTIKNDNVRVSDGSGPSQRYLMSISCDVNVLVTVGDRGWRECGAQVVLESVDHKDWSLFVKISGATRYSHKAQQFLQPGTTNRYTHAMMWKGGKDWILEFPDRSQWILFKEMYEECYNRNIRAASVKNIPIPGVRLIDDSDYNTDEIPFVRTQKYFCQIGTEVDMAMDTSRILYDLESDDEELISKLRSASENDGTKPLEISEEMFERVMDMFEKISYAQQCEDLTSDEIEHFMVGIGPMDVIKAIYSHWTQKRQRKGMPLIRQLQPPLWERYQHQVKEWELEMSKTHNLSDGCKEKAVLARKPPMFAFCFRPRGLEVPYKGTKQRSQKKFMVLGHHNGVLGELDGLQVSGRKLNGFSIGDEKALVNDKSYVSSDVSPLLQTSTSVNVSQSDAAALGIVSSSTDWPERNQYPKLHRYKSKKVGMHLSPRGSQMASMQFNQRMMGVKSGAWNIGGSEWQSPKQYQLDGFQRKGKAQLGGPDFDEFRLRDASGAARHASNMAKLKRERANRLLIRAEHALHKAVVALMNAEAVRVSRGDANGDG